MNRVVIVIKRYVIIITFLALTMSTLSVIKRCVIKVYVYDTLRCHGACISTECTYNIACNTLQNQAFRKKAVVPCVFVPHI